MFSHRLAIIGQRLRIRGSKTRRIAFIGAFSVLCVAGAMAANFLYNFVVNEPLVGSPNPGPIGGSAQGRSYINNLMITPPFLADDLHVGESVLINGSIQTIAPEDQKLIHHDITHDIGGPGLPIAAAFGPDYQFYVKATLNASSFDVDPHETPKQSVVDGSSAGFYWSITPRSLGRQVLGVTYTGIWISAQGFEIERPLAHQSITVNVVEKDKDSDQPQENEFIQLGHFQIGEVVTTLAGGLALPAITYGAMTLFRRIRRGFKAKRK